MNRRQFVHKSAVGVALSAAAARGFAKEFLDQKPARADWAAHEAQLEAMLRTPR